MNSIKKRTILLIIYVLGICINTDAQEFISLWPKGKKPNDNGTVIKDSLFNERIWRVADPGIFCFPVPAAENKGAAVLICPGGGFERLSHIYNGFQLAKWYNTIGIDAYVLIYRLPHQADLTNRQLAPLQDAQRAMKIIRSNATAWKIDAKKIGVMGTSAGGHLASTLSTWRYDEASAGDTLDHISSRPDFMILLSPVITMGTYTHPGSRRNLLGSDTSANMIRKFSNELHVSDFTPPTFIVHALNDSTVSVRNSLMFYNALIENKIAASIHVFPQGGHGIRLDDNPGSADLWLELLEKWLKETGFITPLPFK